MDENPYEAPPEFTPPRARPPVVLGWQQTFYTSFWTSLGGIVAVALLFLIDAIFDPDGWLLSIEVVSTGLSFVLAVVSAVASVVTAVGWLIARSLG